MKESRATHVPHWVAIAMISPHCTSQALMMALKVIMSGSKSCRGSTMAKALCQLTPLGAWSGQGISNIARVWQTTC